MKYTLLLIGASALLSQGVTTAFSAFGAGNQTVLADSSNTAANGLIWGILIDTANDGFDDLSVAGLANTNLSSDTFVGGTDDFFVLGDLSTLSFAGATGAATTLSYDLGGSIVGGDNYGIFWSDDSTLSAGDSYGFIAAIDDGVDDTIDDTIPASNANNDPTSQFRGSDAALQTLTYSEVIPEPTSGALLGLAGLALVARRKR